MSTASICIHSYDILKTENAVRSSYAKIIYHIYDVFILSIYSTIVSLLNTVQIMSVFI
jgi:hypothetical protein